MNKETIEKYKKLGWEFSSEEHYFSEREWSLKYTSPRMQTPSTLMYFKLKCTIDEMLEKVSEEYLIFDENINFATQFYKNNQSSIELDIISSMLNGKKSVTIHLDKI